MHADADLWKQDIKKLMRCWPGGSGWSYKVEAQGAYMGAGYMEGKLTRVYGSWTWTLDHRQLPPFPPLNLFIWRFLIKIQKIPSETHRRSWCHWLLLGVSGYDDIHLENNDDGHNYLDIGNLDKSWLWLFTSDIYISDNPTMRWAHLSLAASQ